jgi:hypothetical protein
VCAIFFSSEAKPPVSTWVFFSGPQMAPVAIDRSPADYRALERAIALRPCNRAKHHPAITTYFSIFRGDHVCNP